MTTILIYLLKVALSISIVTLYFHTCLKKETFFKTNKITMFALLILSLIIPFFELPQISFEKIQTTVTELDIFLASGKEIEIFGNRTAENDAITLIMILFSIWACGTIFRFIKMLISHIRIKSILFRSYEVENEELRVKVGSDNIPSFSYFNTIFLSANDYSENKESIITHEKAHIKLNHSYEIIFMEIIQALQWFNPFVYILKKDLIDIHEFEADNYVLDEGIDSYNYQHLLIKKAVGTGSYTLANSFNHSTIKKRITMMKKTKSSKSAWLKLLGVVPVTLVSSILCISMIQSCDKSTVDDNAESKTEASLEVNDSIYSIAEQMPQFPGGESELMRFISKNVKYPEIAQENGIQGCTVLSFVIEKDGTVSNVEVVRPIDPALDKEAKRVIESFPIWEPGMHQGENVRVKYSLPLFFRLE